VLPGLDIIKYDKNSACMVSTNKIHHGLIDANADEINWI